MIILSPTHNAIKRAASMLEDGKLVVFPTETVFGLGANAFSKAAVQSIFFTKGRCRKNPLIVHISSIKQARDLAYFSPCALQLAQKFWPGPLTLVLPRLTHRLASCVYADLDTIGIRIPSHPIAHALLKALPFPIAAPSANISGYLSPTRARHVFNAYRDRVIKPDALLLDIKKPFLDCERGIESTIVGFLNKNDNQPVLLRHGAIDIDTLQKFLNAPIVDGTTPHVINNTTATIPSSPLSPGQALRHYAPLSKLILNVYPQDTYFEQSAWILFGPCSFFVPFSRNLSQHSSFCEASYNLFDHLYKMDGITQNMYLKNIRVMPIPKIGLGKTINDRLERAAYSG